MHDTCKEQLQEHPEWRRVGEEKVVGEVPGEAHRPGQNMESVLNVLGSH